MRVVRVICGLFLTGLVFSASAQNELGFKFGFSNYLGDLAPSIVPSESKPSFGIVYRYNLNSKWKFRTGIMYGRISGTDNNFQENEERNLSFRTNMWEMELLAEFHIIPFIPGMSKLTFSPYIVGGIAGFRFQPQAPYYGSYINLRGVGTEGQTVPGSNQQPYGMYSVSFPIGIGFKKTISDLLTFGLEVSYRPTLTDYLDDVSRYYADPAQLATTETGQYSVLLADRGTELGLERAETGSLRGNPEDNDKYLVLVFSISKRLGYAPCYTF